MTLTSTQTFIIAIMFAIGTIISRFLPFILFKDNSFSYGIPEAIAILCIAVLHFWKENTLLSIGVGTVIYMVLVQFVFI